MRVVLVLACLLGLSLGASLLRNPLACKSPPLLTGAFSLITQNEKLLLHAQYEYDAWQQRMRIYEVGTYQNHSFTFDVLLLFNEGLVYEINSQASTCVKMPLHTPFQPMGVPPNATLLGSAMVGSSSAIGEGLLIDTWTGQTPKGAKYFLTVTEFGCVPVSVMYQSKDFGWMIINFFNNVNGVLNPAGLDPPPFCPGSEFEAIGKPSDFFTVVHNIGKKAS